MATAVSADSMGPGNENPATASVLTDNVLLEIFDFCREPESEDQSFYYIWEWQLLAQVCRRWRQIIFASPRRLNLLLLCKEGTPVRKYLGIWPVIPILIQYGALIRPSDEDNVIAALEHPDRVCRVGLSVTGAQLAKMSTVIQQPFPMLSHLSICSKSETGLVLPSKFLGGFAPCLQELYVAGIAFPSLPTLLLSASNLVELNLCNIPRTGYISPDAMAAHLAALPRLKTFDVLFNSYFDRIPSRPIIRSVLPSLQSLLFTGDSEYLEHFLARIDTPQLDTIMIYYWDQDIEFSVPKLASFINRSESLKQILSGHCQITVDHDSVVDLNIGASPETPKWECKTGISICVLCEGVDEQISHLGDILSSISPILSDVIHLTFKSVYFLSESKWMSQAEDLDDVVWLLLLRRFSSVRTLFVSDNMSVLISQALEYVDEAMITEVLPALELFCLGEEGKEEEEEEEEEDRPMSGVHKFINLRQDYGRPVTFVETKADFEERLKS